MEQSTIRVLVVDDYQPFRRFVCERFGERQDVRVIGEASDGLDAIRKAEELQPDLIVLDIGLPSLNGIEAARRIPQALPCLQNTLLEPRIFRRSGARGFRDGGKRLRC